MNPTELCYLPVSALSPLLKSRALSPVEVVQAYLDRIAALNPRTRSYLTVTADHALAQAQAAEREITAGRWRGPLHGVPVALKDLFFTKGIRTTSGSRVFDQHVPTEDAVAWERLRNVGAVLLGKTNLHEFAYGPTGENPSFGTARNPWNASRIPGGSSSGSATAVAYGEAAIALGTDTGGSIRIPAALSGVVGLKPTYGRVSRHGVTPLGWSFDHMGPLTRSVEDAALTLNALAGHDPHDPTSAREPVPDFTATLRQGVEGLRVGVPGSVLWNPVDPEVAMFVSAAIAKLAELGASVVEVDVPALDDVPANIRVLVAVEAMEYHAPLLRAHGGLYGEDVRIRLEAGRSVTLADYAQALEVRKRITAALVEALTRVDVLASPAVLLPAPPLGAQTVDVDGTAMDTQNAVLQATRTYNVSGLPAISVPCGFTTHGLPVGLQLAGRHFDEATVLRAAHTYEQATGWHKRRPPEP